MATIARSAGAARLCTFTGGDTGDWAVTGIRCVAGEALSPVARVAVHTGEPASPRVQGPWLLQGIKSHERYVTRPEKERLVAQQPTLGRPAATCAALIPLRKNAAWWALTQDERRHILEDRSAHIATGLRYLPAIARRLYHCRDLSEQEPFDFLTWFEFAPPDAAAFDDLLAALRTSEEWSYVDRDVEVRLTWAGPSRAAGADR
jgi:hypothetical protein